MEINYSKASDKERAAFEHFLQQWNDKSETIQVQTSGSTGIPQSIRLKKDDMVKSAKRTLEYLGIERGGNSLICLSMETIAGKMMAVRSIIGDLNIILSSVSSNPLLNIDDRIALCAMVPLQLENILMHRPESLIRIDHLLIGGASVSPSLEKTASDHNLSFWHTYGMTETISHVALRKGGKDGESFFTALPGITFSEKNGKLIIHDPAIGHNELLTNDLVELMSPTRFNYIGRADFMINSGGIKFNPEELEKMISSMISSPYFIGGLPDETLGEKIVLFIEGSIDDKTDPERFRELLPKHALPKEIIHVKAFTRTSSGKINRFETIKPFR